MKTDAKTRAELRRLEEAATRATLLVDFDRREHGVDQLVYLVRGTNNTLTVAFGTSDGNENDLPLLAAARNALPGLLDDANALAAAEARIAELEAVLSRAWHYIGNNVPESDCRLIIRNQIDAALARGTT